MASLVGVHLAELADNASDVTAAAGYPRRCNVAAVKVSREGSAAASAFVAV